jgi:hypothetical protein
MDSATDGCDLSWSMRIGEPQDPALAAATRALSSRKGQPSSGFASIELRVADSRWGRLAPAGYFASGFLGLLVVAVLWAL